MDLAELSTMIGVDLTKDADQLVPVEGTYDFTIFTRDHDGNGLAVKAFEEKIEGQEDPDFMLSGIASSTIRDRHGDTILPSAILDMEKQAKNNLTILLNHEHKVPEDIAGSVVDAKVTSVASDDAGNPIFDLSYKLRINKANPRAVETFKAIKGGTSLAMSIGARIPEGGAVRNKKTGSLLISHVDLLETSIVAIPANPRTWIDAIAKSFKAGPSNASNQAVTLELQQTNNDSGTATATATATVVADTAPDPQTIVPDDVAASADDPSTDTDAPPQDAQLSSPENDGAVATPDVIAAANDVLERSSDPQVADDEVRDILADAHNALVATTNALIEVDVARAAAISRAEAAETERDQMRSDTENVIRAVADLIDQVGNLPAGRTASFKNIQHAAAAQAASFEGLGLAPEVVRLLRSSNP